MALQLNTPVDPQGNYVNNIVSGIAYMNTVPLAANAEVYTPWIDHSLYIGIDVVMYSDVASAANGRVVEYSYDGVAAFDTATGSYDSTNIGSILKRSFKPSGKYFRYHYINGGAAQTIFYFEIRLNTTVSQPAMDNIGNSISNNTFATVTKSALFALDTDSVVRQLKQNAGSLKVEVSNLPTTQPVSGSVSVSNFPSTQPVSGPLTDTQLRATALPISGTVTANITFPTTQPVSGSVSVSNFPATQPVSLATNTPDITDRVGRLLGHVTVDNASIPVTGNFFQATQPVSGTVSVNTITGFATETGNLATLTAKDFATQTTLAAIKLGIPAGLGQSTMTASMPVVIASNQSSLPTTVSGTVTVAPVIPAPTGAQANAWNAASVLALGVSSAVDIGGKTTVSVFGNSSAAVTLTVQNSADNSNFYDVGTFSVTGGNFGFTFTTAARYLKLKSSAASTITATISAK